MGRARSNKERMQQIGRWLSATFQTPYPVAFRFPKKIAAHPNEEPIIKRTGYFGSTERIGRKIIIRIAVRPSINRYCLIETMLHEFAHAVSLRHDAIEDKRLDHGAHDEAWGLEHAKIYRRFFDEGGHEASGRY